MTDNARVRWSFLLILLIALLAWPTGVAEASTGEALIDRQIPDGPFFGEESEPKPVRVSAIEATPTIDIWYGLNQSFGEIGRPQGQINILGNAYASDGIKSLKYSLNGGSQRTLSIGPDGRRLLKEGDFNVELFDDELNSGSNSVEITATANDNSTKTITVTVNYRRDRTWPVPTTHNWTSNSLHNQAQVVDGKWEVASGSAHIIEVGYDRLIAIGDLAWRDFEVTVSIRVDEVDPSGYNPTSTYPGVGFIVHWTGHSDVPIFGWQPKTGWRPYSALAWYAYRPADEGGERLQILNEYSSILVQDPLNRKLTLGVTYNFKLRVEKPAGQRPEYRLKVWQAGNDEPPDWQMTGLGAVTDHDYGSILLLAHHVDASFGTVVVNPLGEFSLSVNETGNGSVTVEPDKPVYQYGELVTVTATADLGWTFANWSGDATGTSNPVQVTMDGDKVVTANFSQNQYTLAVNVVGSGSVARDPNKLTYPHGEVVTLTATADPGWTFANWSGDAVGTSNPVQVTMDGNKTVAANFSQNQYTLTVSMAGSGSVTRSPDQLTYTYGEVVTLTAHDEGDWTFTGWSGAVTGDQNPVSLTMDANKTVTANFSQGDYFLTVNTNGNGSVSLSPLRTKYLAGEAVTLNAEPDLGWTFTGWSGDLSGKANPATITMSEHKKVTATFTPAAVTMKYLFVPLVVK